MGKKLAIVIVGLTLMHGLSWAEEIPQEPQAQTRPLGLELAKGVASPLLSVLYFPLKFSLGTVGAVLGGVSGWATGGNERAAQGIWRPLTGGTYFITPQVIDGERPFLPLDGGVYAQPPRYSGPSGSSYIQP